jgi:fumarylacetoacetase
MRMLNLRTFSKLCVFCLLLFSGKMATADSKFFWPQADAPYEETDPFIEPVEKETLDEDDSLDEKSLTRDPLQTVPLEDKPLRVLPLEDDPLMRTPLEERQEQEGLTPSEDASLPDYPLEDLDRPLSHKTSGKKKLVGSSELNVENLLVHASVEKNAIFSAVVDEKHLRSWVLSANDSHSNFPIQNLPYGVFTPSNISQENHIGVAIGDQILDLYRGVEAGLFQHLPQTVQQALKAKVLNPLMRLGPDAWHQVRATLISVLRSDNYQLRNSETLREFLLISKEQVTMYLPFEVGDYTDFYTSLNHATNVGKRFRPDNPLLPNFKYLPVAYHGRASSVVVSGTPIRRPMGQVKKKDREHPDFLPTAMLDYEMELGAVVGVGNNLGERIAIKDAGKHLFGMVIVNDWSARDVQKWEYQPLGPFNGKNFATTVSPWVVTMEALEPYRIPGPLRNEGDPEMMAYLKPVQDMGFDITVEVWLSSKRMRDQGMEPMMLSRGNFDSMYWTVAQMLAHHTSTGANLRAGDLLGSGTISGCDEGAKGCLLEILEPGSDGVLLSDGTRRTFLEDGDQVILKAYSYHQGMPRIGFGECCGIVSEVAEFDK